ncbi:hypothetical protein ACQPUY_11725 [Clostridium nigeriense]|uniref:hypothetical protein n=1 Tax=Clostridium nigeriense TaxID=1805470 RepID=UPI003D324956
MKKEIITWPRVILFCITIWGLLHITPHNALRTRLFLEGHPKLAFTTSIEEIKLGSESERVKFYIFSPKPKDRVTGNSKLAYKTTRIGIFYIVTYHGGG